MSTGTLRIHLSHGVGLRAMDFNGSSDPYVKITVGGETKVSRTVKKDLSPNWNEFFEFPGALDELTACPLELHVFDADFIKRDDPLGHAEVALHELHSRCRAP